MEPVPFAEQLAAARAGDEAAFIALFRAVQPSLLRYLRALGGPLAEDAAAETWVSVVRSLDRFSGDADGWRAWVFTIGHARLRDEQRRAARSAVPVDAEERLSGQPAPDDVPAAVAEIVSTEAALTLISRLPRDQAEAVLLRHMAGLDVKQAAAVLGKRRGAVRVATHRGLQRLAVLLEPGPESQAGQESADAGVTESHARTMKG
jgi:RNA polymerase sigma-70 factor (ECF subfamily)